MQVHTLPNGMMPTEVHVQLQKFLSWSNVTVRASSPVIQVQETSQTFHQAAVIIHTSLST